MIKLLDILKESTEPTIFYFAYGSNMEHKRMKRRCPDAVKYSDGVLFGWKRVVNEKGVDTIVRGESNDDHVEGTVWLISKSDVETLDKREGVHVGDYIKRYLEIDVPGKDKICLVYIATNSKPGTVKANYKRIVKKGEEENKIR